MITSIILGAAALVFGVFAVRFAIVWRNTEGGPWKKAVAAAGGSATFLWSYLVIGASTLLGYSSELAAMANSPEVQKAIKSLPPEAVAIAGIVIGVVTILARMRTIFKAR
jgi:hypothetical protein